VNLPYVDHVEEELQRKQIGNWTALQRLSPGVTFWRLYRSLDETQMEALVQKAVERNPSYKPPPWRKRFFLDFQDGGAAQRLRDELNSWRDVVKMAYIAPQLVAPGTNPLSRTQWYREKAPAGIDAKYANATMDPAGNPVGDGAGQEVIDLEAGWMLDHEDLVDRGIQDPLVGDNLPTAPWRPHGTNVLGVLCAADNDKGMLGVVPNVSLVNVVSHSADPTRHHEAMLMATANLSFGGVLVLETTLSWVDEGPDFPFETESTVFDDIKSATDSGLVVVEAAGNGNQNLDAYLDEQGNQKLNRGSGDFQDSGAIMVGAASNTNRSATLANLNFVWQRQGSNYGSRIDCFAAGAQVCTTDSAANNAYSCAFGGTSSATAIVAGAALSVQCMAQSLPAGQRLAPGLLRQILSDPALNTPTPNPDNIGVMPNLKRIHQRLTQGPYP